MNRIEYYEEAFKRLEKDQKNTWNWAAFFLGPGWLAYRKMPLYAVGYNLFMELWMLFCLAFGTDAGYSAVNIFIKHIPQLLGFFDYSSVSHMFPNDKAFLVLLLLSWGLGNLLLGYFGNALYYGTVKNRILKGYHLMENYRPTSTPAMLMGFFSNFAIFAVDFFSNKQNKVKSRNIRITKENIHAYLDLGKKNSNLMKCVNALICVLFCLNIALVTIASVKSVMEQVVKIQQEQQSQNMGNYR